MKSHHNQTLSCTLKPCIFSFGFNNFVHLSTTIFIKRFWNFLFFKIKNALLRVLFLLHSCFVRRSQSCSSICCHATLQWSLHGLNDRLCRYLIKNIKILIKNDGLHLIFHLQSPVALHHLIKSGQTDQSIKRNMLRGHP